MKFSTLFLLTFFVAPALLAQDQPDEEKTFGVFQVSCKTDRMTDERSCMIQLTPAPEFYVDNRVSAFLVFLTPDEGGVTSAGFAKRLRVDKNLAIVGDCLAIEAGICMFSKKAQQASAKRFLKEIATGTTLHVEVSTKVFDFDLADYRTALAAYHAMKGGDGKSPGASPKQPGQ